MGRVQARAVFYHASLSLYKMPNVLYGGGALQVPGNADNAACGRLGAGAAARALVNQGRAGDHGHPFNAVPPMYKILCSRRFGLVAYG